MIQRFLALHDEYSHSWVFSGQSFNRRDTAFYGFVVEDGIRLGMLAELEQTSFFGSDSFKAQIVRLANE
jgi:hypothetical protein